MDTRSLRAYVLMTVSTFLVALIIPAYCSFNNKRFEVEPRKGLAEEKKNVSKPYEFGYEIKDKDGNLQHRHEHSDEKGVRRGSYGYVDAKGVYRKVNYIADENGFRVVVDSNEPGLSTKTKPANVQTRESQPIPTEVKIKQKTKRNYESDALRPKSSKLYSGTHLKPISSSVKVLLEPKVIFAEDTDQGSSIKKNSLEVKQPQTLSPSKGMPREYDTYLASIPLHYYGSNGRPGHLQQEHGYQKKFGDSQEKMPTYKDTRPKQPQPLSPFYHIPQKGLRFRDSHYEDNFIPKLPPYEPKYILPPSRRLTHRDPLASIADEAPLPPPSALPPYSHPSTTPLPTPKYRPQSYTTPSHSDLYSNQIYPTLVNSIPNSGRSEPRKPYYSSQYPTPTFSQTPHKPVQSMIAPHDPRYVPPYSNTNMGQLRHKPMLLKPIYNMPYTMLHKPFPVKQRKPFPMYTPSVFYADQPTDEYKANPLPLEMPSQDHNLVIHGKDPLRNPYLPIHSNLYPNVGQHFHSANPSRPALPAQTSRPAVVWSTIAPTLLYPKKDADEERKTRKLAEVNATDSNLYTPSHYPSLNQILLFRKGLRKLVPTIKKDADEPYGNGLNSGREDSAPQTLLVDPKRISYSDLELSASKHTSKASDSKSDLPLYKD